MITGKGAMKTTVESAEVLYATDAVVTVDAAAIAALKRDASRNPRRRIRLCAHGGVADRLHEMLIVHTSDTYVRPHKHIGKSESFHVIEGEVDVVVFDDEGGVSEVIQMGTVASGRPFFYRIATPLYHTLLIRSAELVFHETTNGPFSRADLVFAPWAPDETDPAAVDEFLGRVNDTVRARLSAAPAKA
jgi:cupin fold WbuC family metalloprotein